MPFHPPRRLAPLLAVALALTVPFAPPTRAAADPLPFALRDLHDPLVMLPVAPAGVVTLAAYDPASGKPLAVRWTIGGGAIAHGSREARWKAPDTPGVYPLVGTAQLGERVFRRELNAFVTVPTHHAKHGVLNGYKVGRYPALMAANPRGKASRSSRAATDLLPGFIKLDADSRKARLSRHFTLGQFEAKDGRHDEKYMFVSSRLIAKLERIVEELNAQGYEADGLRIMSGYRTPAYNAGIGNKTSLSRHTYGDAADILADDWNRDGAITRADAQILYRIADRLDRTTELAGGLSLYEPTSAHGWFVHVDTRGKASRW